MVEVSTPRGIPDGSSATYELRAALKKQRRNSRDFGPPVARSPEEEKRQPSLEALRGSHVVMKKRASFAADHGNPQTALGAQAAAPEKVRPWERPEPGAVRKIGGPLQGAGAPAPPPPPLAGRGGLSEAVGPARRATVARGEAARLERAAVVLQDPLGASSLGRGRRSTGSAQPPQAAGAQAAGSVHLGAVAVGPLQRKPTQAKTTSTGSTARRSAIYQRGPPLRGPPSGARSLGEAGGSASAPEAVGAASDPEASPDPSRSAGSVQEAAATRIQAALRGGRARQAVRQQEDAATRVQAVFRGSRAVRAFRQAQDAAAAGIPVCTGAEGAGTSCATASSRRVDTGPQELARRAHDCLLLAALDGRLASAMPQGRSVQELAGRARGSLLLGRLDGRLAEGLGRCRGERRRSAPRPPGGAGRAGEARGAAEAGGRSRHEAPPARGGINDPTRWLHSCCGAAGARGRAAVAGAPGPRARRGGCRRRAEAGHATDCASFWHKFGSIGFEAGAPPAAAGAVPAASFEIAPSDAERQKQEEKRQEAEDGEEDRTEECCDSNAPGHWALARRRRRGAREPRWVSAKLGKLGFIEVVVFGMVFWQTRRVAHAARRRGPGGACCRDAATPEAQCLEEELEDLRFLVSKSGSIGKSVEAAKPIEGKA
ncbi:unnamed protein product [Prorocentrum cordatum]|uniref:Uncharacterized protein n=1 Tax=Prorocentrum cordatum TaxID=2364126 RepID=A0ABN9TRG0_9DINO|nr:unnamed protein product [Polarella glacialis]